MTVMCSLEELRLSLRLKLRKILAAALVALWVTAWLTRPPLLETASYSKEILDRGGRLLRLKLSGDEKYRVYTSLASLPRDLVEGVLAREDRYFYFHPGVNPVSLLRAFNSTYLKSERRIGASTITMQLARMTSTRGSKTVSGKFVQMASALYMEAVYSKDEILEAYLNLLPYGGNIEGVGAAALVLFRKAPSDLSSEEMAHLAGIPQDPNSHNAEASFAIGRLPFAAPHFVNLGLERGQGNPESRLTLSLDRGLQRLVELKLQAHLDKNRDGVNNGAVMVLDHRSMEVLALVGSGGFFDQDIGGQINGAVTPRSPGSALKPFVYALAMDQGLIHPLSLLKDSPASFGGFDPENFDQKFFGPLSATEALVQSRNVPAVQLSSELVAPTFYEFLRAAGIRIPRPPEYYGLALGLGAAEVTMEDLIALYAMLANGGEWRAPRIFLNQKLGPAHRLLSREAAFMTLAMLRENPRSGNRLLEKLAVEAVPLAWKTGTSAGFRDAWTVGLVGPYVVAVWLGNFNNEGNAALVGREIAAPLFFSLADGLRPRVREPSAWTSPLGLNLKRVEVCGISGQLPGPHCHAHKKTWFVPGTSPIGECTIHREILVSRATGERACDERLAGLRREVREFWPSDLLQLFRAAGLARRTPPPFARDCKVDVTQNFGVAPAIVSPRKAVTYTLRVVAERREQSQERIAFSAIADGDVSTLHWFVDSTYLGKSEPSQPLFWSPKAGRHVVRVSDDLGRSDSRSIDVRITR